jgi:two-component system LytT family sensor kinase
MPFWAGLGFWIMFTGLFALQAIVVNSEPWLHAVTKGFQFWVLWIVFFPITVWISLKFPFESRKVPTQLCIHILTGVGIITLSQIAYRTVLPLPAPVSPDPASTVSKGSQLERVPVGMRAAPDVLIYLVTMSACIAFAHYRTSQERERHSLELEARLAEARLQTLRMQINPHFLFNTLNAISSLVHQNPAVADDMITDLSELLRVSLESSGQREIPLSREKELLGYYLSIERRRFGDRLQVDQRFNEDVLNVRVPALVLQPIVENAIRHGIEPQTGVGRISITAEQADSRLKLCVQNSPLDGASAARAGRPRGQGIGLANTQARLKQLYGENHSFTYGPKGDNAWEVRIMIPIPNAARIGAA